MAVPQLQGVLTGHLDTVATVAVLPGGRLASGSFDHSVRVWDVATQRELLKVENAHTAEVVSVTALTDSNDTFASASVDRTIKVWDTATGALCCTLTGHTRKITCLVAMPHGLLASASMDKSIRLWDVAGKREIACMTGHAYTIVALVALLNDRLASADHDGKIKLWNAKTQTEICEMSGHKSPVTALIELPNELLATGSRDRTIRLWNQEVRTTTCILHGHTGGVTALVRLNSGRLASGGEDGTIRLWDIMRREAAIVLHCGGQAVRCLATTLSDILLSSGGTSQIQMWDIEVKRELAALSGHAGPVMALASLGQSLVASGSVDGLVKVWDVELRTELRTLRGHQAAIVALALVPGGSLPEGTLASASLDGWIKLWDVDIGCELGSIHRQVMALGVLQDGRLATGGVDNIVTVWGAGRDSVFDSEPEVELTGHSGWVVALAAFPEADTIFASGSRDGVVKVWDPRSALPNLATFKGHTEAVTALAVLPASVHGANGGRLLASASADTSVRVWDVDMREFVALLQGDRLGVTSLCVVLPNGWLASGSRDKVLRVWGNTKATLAAVMRPRSHTHMYEDAVQDTALASRLIAVT